MSNEQLSMPDISSSKRATFAALIILVIIFMSVILFAPVQTAALLNGTVGLTNSVKTIEHLHGGVVANILKKNGDMVHQGDVVLELENSTNKAQLKLYEERKIMLLAKKARLAAEFENENLINYDDLLGFVPNERAVSAIGAENKIFQARKDFQETRSHILNSRIAQLDQEVQGAQKEVQSTDAQLKLIKEETDALKSLLDKQWIDKPKFLALKREAARLNGRKGERLGRIAQLQQKKGETKTQLMAVKKELRREILEEIASIDYELNSLEEKIALEKRQLAKTQVIAPATGAIAMLGASSPGEVIKPGDIVLEVVPDFSTKLIEAKILTKDIDVISVGMPASIRLLAHRQNFSSRVAGTVQKISPNTQTDLQTGVSYYPVWISIDFTTAPYSEKEFYLGMPVEVAILAEKRTFLDYLLEPIVLTGTRAFS